MLVFHSNLMTIDALNRANGKPAYGVNQFTDMHPEEFRSRYLGYKPCSAIGRAKGKSNVQTQTCKNS